MTAHVDALALVGSLDCFSFEKSIEAAWLSATEGYLDFSSSVLNTPLSMFALLFASYSLSISLSFPFLIFKTQSLFE